MITTQTLTNMAGGRPNQSNVRSVALGLDAYGVGAGLNQPHRLAHYLGQLIHESVRFRYDREIWGPTKAQKGYEGRTDLGNTQPGDGSKFRGRTAIQITGRYNTTRFRDWCRANISPSCPDFVADPDKMNTDPWEGLGPIWYWDVGNPEGKSLNRYADANNIEMVTRRINGGLNGYKDRIDMYVRAALVLMGYEMQAKAVEKFQRDVGITVDDIAGPATRGKMHEVLRRMPPLVAEEPAPTPMPPDWAGELVAVSQSLEAAAAKLRRIADGL